MVTLRALVVCVLFYQNAFGLQIGGAVPPPGYPQGLPQGPNGHFPYGPPPHGLQLNGPPPYGPPPHGLPPHGPPPHGPPPHGFPPHGPPPHGHPHGQKPMASKEKVDIAIDLIRSATEQGEISFANGSLVVKTIIKSALQGKENAITTLSADLDKAVKQNVTKESVVLKLLGTSIQGGLQKQNDVPRKEALNKALEIVSKNKTISDEDCKALTEWLEDELESGDGEESSSSEESFSSDDSKGKTSSEIQENSYSNTKKSSSNTNTEEDSASSENESTQTSTSTTKESSTTKSADDSSSTEETTQTTTAKSSSATYSGDDSSSSSNEEQNTTTTTEESSSTTQTEDDSDDSTYI